MIELQFENGKTCIYSSSDWKKLRTDYRIMGESLGSMQNTMALPVVLLPEEVILLMNKRLAKLVSYPSLSEPPKPESLDECNKLQTDLLKSEQEVYTEIRKKELEQVVDKIMEGKRRRLRSPVIEDRNVILEKELQKSVVTENNMVWPILTAEPSKLKGSSSIVDVGEIFKLTTKVKSAVYSDLWERGYYITTGHKFGGDFLVYLGDPSTYHAVYIIRCIEDESKEIPPTEFIAYGRLGTAVKKKAVFASLQADNSIKYITLNWSD